MEQVHRQTREKRNPTVPVETENLCENETWGRVMPQCSKGQKAIKGTGGGLGQKVMICCQILLLTTLELLTVKIQVVSTSKVDHLS